MERGEAIEKIRGKCNEISAGITGIHPLVSALGEPMAQAEILKALFELTKQVEIVKKQALKLSKGDDSKLL